MTTTVRPAASALDRALAAGHFPARHPDGHYVIESSTRPGLDHVLDVTAEGGIQCSCEGASFGRDCLHAAALRYCLLHGIMGVYALCVNCRAARVAKQDAWCPGCVAQRDACAEQGEEFFTADDFFDPARVATLAQRYGDDPVHARQVALTVAAQPTNVVPFATRRQAALADACVAIVTGSRRLDIPTPLDDLF